MASSALKENNSILSHFNDNNLSEKHLNEHEETIKLDQMASSKKLSNSNDEEVSKSNLIPSKILIAIKNLTKQND